MDSTLEAHARTYSDFTSILNDSAYEPLPDDWVIGMTDVVDSTSAIRRGAYQDVNFTGASVVAAVGNIWGTYDFPFTFGGDGASFALPANGIEKARTALQQVIAMANSRFGLTLRAGLLPVSEIRAHGRDIKIARYAVSEHTTYSMFAGGGLRWAEREMKRGKYAVEPIETISEVDLTGLSCEWRPFPSRHGLILSLLVEPRDNKGTAGFSTLAQRVLSVLDSSVRHGHPLPTTSPTPIGAKSGLDQQTWSEIVMNSDFRKYDDVLRLTLDCSEEQADTIEGILKDAAAEGLISYGMHRQSHALMTCLVPTGNPKSHLHFLDGLDGGYARAAENMNAARKEETPLA
ncbi:DUF3095 domain-containing protein [Phyllobacterium sp. YR531]|uniref:DUF3095 domain-containing protein n=1 Tax=Phyllobacterium sp. YR531 TaxID=1144343 RepID=UPI00026F646A|nr:DUF3095 domain-containing protein [Phyllobacterium sp. YR531]EJN00054.1 Protein of unknown function (DUF3095) [Phyllobacterium sp. YR531]